MNNNINWDIIFINTLSQESNLFINKKILAKFGLDLAVFISFLANQYNYYLKENQLMEDKSFFATDDDIFLFTNMPRTRITSIKKQAEKLGLVQLKKAGQPVKTYYKLNFELLLTVLSSTESIKDLAYNRALSEEKLTEDYIRTLSYRDLRLLCKKLSISYNGLSTKEDYINKILKEISSKDCNNSNFITCADKSHTHEKINVCGISAHACADKSHTRVRDFCTNHNINQANIKSTKSKNHDNVDELDFFENLFKEFGINFTKTNKNSVLKLRKKLSLKEVENYLIETYKAITENNKVKNVAALFSNKISKGERQINERQINEKQINERQINNPNMIKEEIIDDIFLLIDCLDEYDRLKLEEKAINYLSLNRKTDVEFIMNIKEKNYSMYKSLLKPYLEKFYKEFKKVN